MDVVLPGQGAESRGLVEADVDSKEAEGVAEPGEVVVDGRPEHGVGAPPIATAQKRHWSW